MNFSIDPQHGLLSAILIVTLSAAAIMAVVVLLSSVFRSRKSLQEIEDTQTLQEAESDAKPVGDPGRPFTP